MSNALGIPQSPPNTSDSYLYARLVEIYNAINILANGQSSALLQNDILQLANITLSVVASEAIPANSFVNMQPGGMVRNATAVTGRALPLDNAGYTLPVGYAISTDRICQGFSSKAIALGATGSIVLAPCIINISGLSIGSNYYLAANTPGTQGQIYAAPDSASGNGFLHQYIGMAITAKQLYFNPELNPLQW